ncbi:MAG: hypothetical protein M1324_03700 [Patescibacteria group bacterium]|nr:hypothetical protein [Patescibacteria group bacterium]
MVISSFSSFSRDLTNSLATGAGQTPTTSYTYSVAKNATQKTTMNGNAVLS